MASLAAGQAVRGPSRFQSTPIIILIQPGPIEQQMDKNTNNGSQALKSWCDILKLIERQRVLCSTPHRKPSLPRWYPANDDDDASLLKSSPIIKLIDNTHANNKRGISHGTWLLRLPFEKYMVGRILEICERGWPSPSWS